MKITKITRFSNQNKNKASLVLNPNREAKQIKTWQSKNKNPTRVIAKKKKKKNKVMIRNKSKIGVEQTKGSAKFYLYLYPLGT